MLKNQRSDVLQGTIHDHSHSYLHTHPIPSPAKKFRADLAVESAVANLYIPKKTKIRTIFRKYI